jgi:hypothetical protein
VSGVWSCRPAGSPDGPYWRWILILGYTGLAGRLFITAGLLGGRKAA